MQNVKYGLNDPRLAPRRTKLEIPGWAGNASRAPMARASRPGIACRFRRARNTGSSCFIPTTTNCASRTKDGRLILDGDWGDPPDSGLQWPPFRSFGDAYYTYQILLDLKVERASRSAPSRTRASTPTRPTPCRSPCRR